jgi:hypothetical protein
MNNVQNYSVLHYNPDSLGYVCESWHLLTSGKHLHDRVLSIRRFLLKWLYQATKVSDHALVCEGYRFCLVRKIAVFCRDAKILQTIK